MNTLNRIEQAYKDKSEEDISEELIRFKEPNISWLEFYHRIMRFNQETRDQDLMYEMMIEGKLMEVRILLLCGIIPTQSAVNMAYTYSKDKFISESYENILNELQKYGIRPTNIGFDQPMTSEDQLRIFERAVNSGY